MRVRDYLNIGRDRIEKIKATATFPPTRGISDQDLALGLPPFEGSIVEDIVRQQLDANGKTGAYPAIVQIRLSSGSDCRSIRCRSDAEGQTPAVSLDTRGFTQLVNGLLRLKAKWVDFSGGEPTLCPEFRRIARTCIDSGLRIRLLTSAAWPDDEMASFLAEVFSSVSVNLDADSQQVYGRIHRTGSGEFQRVLRNVERMVRDRERRKSHLALGAEVNLTQTNMNFTEEIAALARDLGLDYVRIRIGQTDPNSLLPEQRERAKVLLRELRAEFHPFPVHWQAGSSSPVPGCRISHFRLVVEATGDLCACPELHSRPHLRPFGNIFSQPVDELWLGPEHRKALRELDRSPCPVSDCPWHRYNCLLPDTHA